MCAVSDEERIAAAEALRERAKRPLGKSMQLMFSETLGLYRTNIGWAKPTKATETWANIVNYLADLIDRETCRNVSGDQDKFECGECGFEMPIWDGDGGWMAFYFCPNCGAAVVDDD